MTASNPPAAPSRWPVADFVDEMAGPPVPTRVPKMARSAASSEAVADLGGGRMRVDVADGVGR